MDEEKNLLPAVEWGASLLPVFGQLETKEQDVLQNLIAGAGTQTAAYIAVYGGQNRRSAIVDAYKFFQREEIQLALKELQTLQRAEFDRLRDQLIYSLIDDAFWDAAEAFIPDGDDKGALKPVPDMPLHVRRRITAHKHTRYGEHIEFIDRLAAKRLLIELLGIGQSSAGMTINLNLGEMPPNNVHAREAKTVPDAPNQPTDDIIQIDLSAPDADNAPN